MNAYTISIPGNLYKKAQQAARRTAQSVDNLIQARLEEALDQPLLDLPADEQAELQALSYLSSDALWTIAREQMASPLQERMSTLMTKNSAGEIAALEYEELAALVERGERLTLRKAQAMKLLLERGYTIGMNDLQPADG